jgi:hypothetical protein
VLAGIDFDTLLDQAVGGKVDLTKPLVDVVSGGDAIQIFLE